MRTIALSFALILTACGAAGADTDGETTVDTNNSTAVNNNGSSNNGTTSVNCMTTSDNMTSGNNVDPGNNVANSGPGPNNVTDLPPFDGTSPLEGAAAPTRVLPEVLNSHVEWFSWDPNLNTLYFAVARGGRGSVTAVTDEYLADNPDAVQEHPYRMWSYQEFADGPLAEEFMRLPAIVTGRGETHWCKWTRTNQEFWCHHNYKKSSEAVLRVTSGNGIDVPLEYESWPLKYWDPIEMKEEGALHEGMMDLTESSAGHLYWTVKIGIGGSNRSYLVRALPDMQEQPLLLAKSTEEMDQLHGVALSADESKLYFTTGAYTTEDKLGKLWQANVQADGSIDAPTVLTDGIYRPRGLTVDEHGFIYVAAGLDVRVFDDLGRDVDSVKVVTDHPDQESLENARSKYSLLSVEFGGPDGNILYIGLGYDRRGVENVDNPQYFTQGGLYRMPLSVRAPWAVQ